MRVFTGFLAFVMLFGMIPMQAQATDTDDIYFEESSNVDLDLDEIMDLVEGSEPTEETTEPETVPETEPETVPETEPETVPETEPETVPETEPEAVPETEPETVPEAEPETKPAAKPAAVTIAPEKTGATNSGEAVATSAAELEAALNEGASTIQITESFEIDRTFYITKDTVIYAEASQTLTRAADFTGDIFVVGEAADGTVCENAVKLTLGKSDSEKEDLLIIDGNKDHMAEDAVVAGSVIFLSGKGQADLYTNLTVCNASKAANVRALEERYALKNAAHIGGAVAVVTEEAVLNIFGGNYLENSVNDLGTAGTDADNISTLGGAVYALGQVNLEGGLFEENHAAYGGAIYANGAEITVKDAVFTFNSASKTGGAFHVVATRMAIENAVFTSNTSVSYAGAIYAENATTAENFDINIKNTSFTTNSATASAGAVYLGAGVRAFMADVDFVENQSSGNKNSGAAMVTGADTYLEIDGGTFRKNKGYNGGALYVYSGALVVANDLIAEENESSSKGGFCYVDDGAELNLYNSTVKKNKSGAYGSAVCAYTGSGSTAKIYNTLFEDNESKSYGAVVLYSDSKNHVIHSCTFKNNVAASYGGAIYVGGAGTLSMYNTTGIGNSASHGGFMYFTKTNTTVNIGGLTVSGNTATTGGPIIWGNIAGAKLYIDKDNYTDLDHTGEYDDAYWKAALYNKLTVTAATIPVPDYLDYGEEEGVVDDSSVDSAEKLAAALAAGSENICISKSFNIDRTFYITKSTKIYAEEAVTLTRDPAFGGDIFVVGESEAGVPCGETAVLTLGNPESSTANLLIIDGNKDNMTANVVGSVIFVTGRGQADLYENLTIQNAKKVGNERTSDADHGVSYPTRIGGAVAVLAASSQMNIYGGTYKNNTVNAEDDTQICFQGGAIYNFGTLNIYGGLFDGNFAGRGGAIYNYRKLNIYKAEFKNNSASATGGVVYTASSTAAKTVVGGENDVVESAVLFTGNTAGTNGGALFIQTNLNVSDAVFTDNTANSKGGAIYSAADDFNLLNCSFTGNTATENGGAIYATGCKLIAKDTSFTDNSAANGGAAYITGKTDAPEFDVKFTNCVAENNNASAAGGALLLNAVRASFSHSSFKGNVAVADGGAISANGETLVFADGEFRNNQAANGGAVCYADGTLSANKTNFDGNIATAKGGAMALSNVTAEILNSQMTGNQATTNGGALCLENDTSASMNKITATGNTAENGGAIMNSGAIVSLHNSTLKNNTATGNAGAVGIYNNGTFKAYDVTFEGNTAVSGGALEIASGTTDNLLQTCIFKNNTASANGGAICVSAASKAELYNATATGNTAVNGGVVYMTDAATNVTLGGLTVSGNTATNGNLVCGGNKDAVLDIDKSKCAEVDTTIVLDAAYWAAAITGELTVKDASLEPPRYNDYGNEDAGEELQDAVDVKSAEELEAALLAGASEIRITESFQVDRTFYVTASTTIFSTAKITLTRASDFAGDIFVVGTINDLNPAEGEEPVAPITLKLGNPNSKTAGLLTIDGNKDNMTTDVLGTVVFVYGPHQADLYENITVKNAYKAGNQRLIGTSIVSYPERVGGAVAIATTSSFLNIYGGTYMNNSVSDTIDGTSSQGGAIYNYGTLKIYGGLFKGNHAARAGVIYNYRTTYIYKAEITNNSASSLGGAIYVPASTACKTYIGLDNDVVEPYVVFSGNHAADNGGALYAQKVVEIHNALFEGNTTSEDGGAISAYPGTFNLSNVTFKDNTATGAGGAIYASKTSINIKNSTFNGNESGTYGGAIYMTGQGGATMDLELQDVKFEKNTADSHGGAVVLLTGARAHMVRTDFTGNTSKSTEKGGAAVYVVGGALSMSGGNLTGNTATRGGAIYSAESTLNLQNLNFAENTATEGAAIYMTGTTVTTGDGTEEAWDAELKNCSFSKNVATEAGGAMYLAEGVKVKMKTMTFTENKTTASKLGGSAIYAVSAVLDINGVQLTGNTTGYNGTIYIAAGTSMQVNKLTADGNTAKQAGAVIYTVGAVDLYNSTLKNNTSSSNGGAIYVYTDGVLKVYNTVFEANTSGSSGGAIAVYSKTKGNLIHTCTFTGNSAVSGGAIYVSNASGLEIYRTIATGNSATKGGFMYETTSGSVVTISDLILSGNTATEGGPIIWGNTYNAKLHIDPSAYVDLDYQGEYDDAYWAAAIANKLTYDFVTAEVPHYVDYASVDPGEDMRNSVKVTSAAELEAALKGENNLICITEDFEIDRTFYITKEVYIFSVAQKVLTRASNFAGDIFVVGEDANGKSALLYGGNANLHLGLSTSDKNDLLIIDGNRDAMTVPVTGSVIFMSNSAIVDLYEPLTIQNCYKSGNVRVLNKSKYSITNASRIGATLVLNTNGSLNIRGGKYINNMGGRIDSQNNPNKNATLGGMIYSTSTINMYGGLFKNNQGGQGGVIYNSGVTRITSGKFISNASDSTAGVIYVGSYSSSHLIIGQPGMGDGILFEGNKAGSNGTCIYAPIKASVIINGNTVFKDNETDTSGTINVYGQLTVKDTQFINNTVGSRGGAIYISVSVAPSSMPTRYVVIDNCTFTGNKGGLGGALQLYAGGDDYANGSKVTVTNCTFENNTSTYYGGAIHMDRKSSLTLKDSTFVGNTSSRIGGAIYAINNSTISISGSTFEKNTSAYSTTGGGGAIYMTGASLSVTDSAFKENTTAYRGGAIYFTRTELNEKQEILTIKDTSFNGNTAAESGGAVYLENIASYMRRVNFIDNQATLSTGYGGAMTMSNCKVELDDAQVTGNSAAKSSGAFSAFSNSELTLNKITATDNQTDGWGGFLYCAKATVKIYDSKLEGNTAGKSGGALMMDSDAIGRVYNCDLIGNTAKDGAAICAQTGGKSVLLNSCDMISNTATGNGGAMYVGNKTDFYVYKSTATGNNAANGGVLYVNNDSTSVSMLKMNVSGNTATESGPIICGNSAKAALSINKSLYTDADVETLDDAYWAAAIVGQLKVTNSTTKPNDYVPYVSRSESGSTSTVKPVKSEGVSPIFNLAKKSSDAKINSTYDKFSKLKNKSNFQSRSTVKFPNINGQTVTVDTFVYPNHGKANNCTVGEGLLIYQAMCYKKAHPKEEVYIDIASYRFSVQAAVNINRNSRYFGYMRQLEDVEYDKYGFVRVAYLLVAAAKMGIHVNVVGHLDAYPMSDGEPGLIKYFSDRLKHSCDSTYAKNKVVGDFMNFTFVEWSLKQRGGTDMMHNKMCAVSHYLDKDGKVHKNAVYSSSSNLDGIRADGCNANWKLQTATIISDHAEIYNTAINYMRLAQKYGEYLDGIMEFQHEVNERSTKQIDLILAGKANEIPKEEQIVYIGTENDDVFELYFTPFGGDPYTWDEKYNPYCKFTRKLHNSEGFIVFGWSAAEYARHAISNQMEDLVSDAFHKNKNLKNKLYIYAEDFDASVYNDLTVGKDIGYLSINKKVYDKVHNKDVQFSYKENGQRYYVSLLNSLNVHGGTMSFQPNFALVIKETDVCASTSVFNTIAQYSMGGATTTHDYGEKLFKEATATTHGYYYQKCAACGGINKLGTIHYSGDWIVDRAATPTKNGIRHKECTVCKQVTESGELVYTEPLSVDLSNLTGRTFTSSTNSTVRLNLGSTPKTFEALIQVPTTVTGSAGVIAGNYSGGKENQIDLEISGGGRPYLYIKSSKKSASVRFNTDIRSDSPVHVAVSVDGKKVSLYINGELKETKTLSRTYPSSYSNFKIGGDNRKNNTGYFRGRIYSVNLFSDVRTATEIQRDVILVPSNSHKLIHASYFQQDTQQTKLQGQTFAESGAVSAEVAGAPKTIEAVVQLSTSVTDYAGVITGNWDNGDAAQMNLEVCADGKLNLRYYSDGNANNHLFNTDIRSNTPTHIAVTMDGTTAKLYVNGSLKETATLTAEIPAVSGNFKIGGDNTEAQEQYFAGTIYSVKMFSDVRTDKEVAKDRISLPEGTEGMIFCGVFENGLTEFYPEARTFKASSAYGIPSLAKTPATIEAVIQVPKNLKEYAGAIVGNYNGTTSKQMLLDICENGKVRLYSKSGSKTNSATFKTDIRSDEPVHIAVTVSSKTAKLYVNGVYKEKITLKNSLPTSARYYYRIGGDARKGNTSYFKGKIYSVTMFSDARTQSEIISDIACVPSDASALLYNKIFTSADRVQNGCTDGSKHTAGDWIIDVEATATANGIKHTECTVCGNRLQVSEIIRTNIEEGQMDFTNAEAGLFFTSEREVYKVSDKLATKKATIEVNLQLPKSQSSRAGTVLGNYNGGSKDQFNLEINTKGRPKLWYKKSGKKYTCQFKTDIRSDNMVNLTITISGKTAKLYLNGVLKETKKLSASVPSVTSNFRIGGDRRTGNTNYFKGTIYSVNVFSDVRTSSEIKMDKIYVPSDSGNLLYSVYFKAPNQ